MNGMVSLSMKKISLVKCNDYCCHVIEKMKTFRLISKLSHKERKLQLHFSFS
jgi:hypothetical protein